MAISAKTHHKMFGLIYFLIGIALAFPGYREWERTARLKADGVEVPGRITGQRISYGRTSKTYHVTVEYEPKGDGAREKEFAVSRARYDRARSDRNVTVRHLPADPDIDQVSGEEKTGLVMILIGGGTAMFGLWLAERGFKMKSPDLTTGPAPTA